jgi:hypothetical protein
MKMRHHQVSQIVIPTQAAHDLGDRQLRKWPMGFQTDGQQRGDHLDQQSRVQAMTLSLHGTNMEDRFEDLPETFNQMMLLPDVPDFCTSHGYLTKIHQIITAGGALLEKEEHHRTKGWTVSLDSTSRHINPPGGMMQHQVFFPVRGVLLFSINRKGVIAFACNDDFGKASTQEPFSQRL